MGTALSSWKKAFVRAAPLVLLAGCSASQPPARDPLMIMSSIPLQWGEASIGQISGGDTEPAPLFTRLADRYQPAMIDDFQKIGEPGKAPLLLIQPRALAPSELVQLDTWIRGGGVALIFADPALDWPSALPLGDQRRPLFTSMLTPLFRHWGLELALPVEDAEEREAQVGAYPVATKSAGIWRRTGKGKASATCAIRADELMALCAVGKGQALLVADADMLHSDLWTDGLATKGTMAWLETLLAESRKPRPLDGKIWEDMGK